MRIPRSLAGIFRTGDGFVTDRRLRSNERFLEHLAFGFPLDHARAQDQVRLLKACKEDWARANPPADGADEHALILRLLANAVQRTVSGIGPDRPITMGLSAGYDSRAILLALRRLNIEPSTYTFGQAGSFDFDFVRDLAARLGLSHVEIDTSKCEWPLEAFDSYVATAALDVVVSPRVVAEKALDQAVPGRVDLHGFLNGVVTGFAGVPSAGWDEAVADFCKKNDAFAYQEHLGVDCSEFMPSKPLIPEEELPFGQQLAMAYRSFQRIRPVPPGHPTNYVFPAEDRDWMGFWLNRQPAELVDQRRYMRFLKEMHSQEFHDLEGLAEDTSIGVKRARMRQFYRQAGPEHAEPRMVKPLRPLDHFCSFACFANNASFRDLVARSLARLRKRNVIDRSFIDKAYRRFAAGEKDAGKMLKGLVATDLVLEAGRFA